MFYAIVLAATDLSDPSSAALRHAASLARVAGGAMIATYVVEDRLPPLVLAQIPDVSKLLAEHREKG